MRKSRIPSRFPVGTRYIVEGKPGKGGKLEVLSRYLIMPNGRRYDLTKSAAQRRPATRVMGAGRFATLGISAE
jgi:hypothetical protein